MRQRLERIYRQIGTAPNGLPEREEGQTLVEYAIVIMVAVMVVLAAVRGFGQTLASLFTRMIGQVSGIGS
jgi:hypothetical protein